MVHSGRKIMFSFIFGHSAFCVFYFTNMMISECNIILKKIIAKILNLIFLGLKLIKI